MPELPLPTGCTGIKALPKFQTVLKNLYYMGALKLRPGVFGISNLNGKCRGMAIFRNNVAGSPTEGDERLYGVFGTTLYRITIQNNRALKSIKEPDMLFENVGTIPGSGRCEIQGGFTRFCIIQLGGLGFIYDDTSGVQQITDVDFLPSVSLTYDSGRFVFVPADGSPMFWSRLDDPSVINASDYADAERETDPNKAVFRVKDTVYLLGDRSIQGLIYNASANTYLPRGGESAAYGYVGGLARFEDWFAFIGQGADGGFDVFMFNGTPQKISNDYISELLNTEYSLSELRNIHAEYMVFSGSPMLIFWLPRHTICFCNGGWSFWQSGVSGESVGTWNVTDLQYAYGFIFTGDKDGNIGYLRQSGDEYGEDIEWLLKLYIQGDQESRFTLRKLALSCTMGRSGTDALDVNEKSGRSSEVAASFSRDGEVYTNPSYRSHGDIGEYGKGMFWGGPIISSRHVISILLAGYGNADLAVQGIGYEAR